MLQSQIHWAEAYIAFSAFNTVIQEEIKSRLRSGNACYYSVQKLLSSRLLSKNLKSIYIELQSCLLFCMVVKLGR